MIKAKFSALFTALAFIGGVAFADPVVIGAGKPGRGYDNWAQDISLAYKQRSQESLVKNFKGSDEITLSICKGEVDFAPSQQDAAYQRSNEGCELYELWTYPSEEYMFLMVPPKSSVDELEDLTASSKVITDEGGSGSDFTLRQLRRIETGEEGSGDEWAQVQVENKSVKAGLGLGASGKVAGVFFVGSLASKDLEFFLKNGWIPVEVYDKDLNDLTFNGQPLYEGSKVNVPGYGKVFTYRVKTFVYGRELSSDEQAVFESVMVTR